MGVSQSKTDEDDKKVETEKALGMARLREDKRVYDFVDMHGGGELVPWFR